MRPNHTARFSFSTISSISGLSVSRDVVYNERQSLPLPAGVSPSVSGVSPVSEAAMKPARAGQQPNKTPSATPAPASQSGESRAERLARIKREIEAGSYDTHEKLERAVERMLGTWNDA